jgi:beta-galactosidase
MIRPYSSHNWYRACFGIASRIAMILLVSIFSLFGMQAFAQKVNPIHIDASAPFTVPAPATYDLGSAKSPSGSVIGLNSRYLTLNGSPWLPVMGEFHFSRYPRAQWEEEILKMKAAGVNIVAAYIIWIHHEEVKGQTDWTGQRDLHAFAELCSKHGMLLVARIGPWDHAEVRNGGLPDWVLAQGPTRVNDPAYLASVNHWYQEVSKQLKGQLWKDGGPVIGIQLENEYSQRGPGAGEEHILKLKELALSNGLDVPLYFVTGWDNAVVPRGAVLPVFGGYPSAPWDGSQTKLPPQEVYAFRFVDRVTANMGAAGNPGTVHEPHPVIGALPYLTAEIGGGNEDTYHRRPALQPDDIAAIFPVLVGSGVNLYGTYMFQGGENPDGRLSTLQESQSTDYPNDVPIKSYDFQAPLGEFGQERQSFRKLKVFQYFLNDFGADLAPMVAHAPALSPKNPADLTMTRAAVRSRGDSGFLFVNNYVREYPMPARPTVQFEIRIPGGVLRMPSHPVDLPSGAYFIWPFNLKLDGINLRYASAQLFTRLASDSGNTIYFVQAGEIPAEFAFDAGGIRTIKASSGETVTDAGTTYVRGVNPGEQSWIDLVSTDGKQLRIVLLKQAEAEDAWKIRIAGTDHLLFTAEDFFNDDDSHPGRIWLRSRDVPRFAFDIVPRPTGPLQASLPLAQAPGTAQRASFTAATEKIIGSFEHRLLQAATDAPPVKLGPNFAWRRHGVAQAPPESELPQAAKWAIAVSPANMAHLSELFLEIKYQGDVARLYSDHRLLTDDFYNGQTWSIGLRRFLDPEGTGKFELHILPLRKDAPVYLELSNPADYSARGQVEKLDSIRLVPEYELVISTGSR